MQVEQKRLECDPHASVASGPHPSGPDKTQDPGALVWYHAACSVIQALDQSPLDMGWMVRMEVQVLVSVCGLPVRR